MYNYHFLRQVLRPLRTLPCGYKGWRRLANAIKIALKQIQTFHMSNLEIRRFMLDRKCSVLKIDRHFCMCLPYCIMISSNLPSIFKGVIHLPFYNSKEIKFELLLPRTNEFGSMTARKDDILPQNTTKQPLKAIQDHTKASFI